MDATVSFICDGLIDHAIKSTLLISVVLIACKTLEPKLSAASRKFVLLLTTLVIFLLPIFGRWITQQAEVRIWTVWRSNLQSASIDTNDAGAVSTTDKDRPSMVPGILDWLGTQGPLKLAVGVWLLGVAVLGIRWLYQVSMAEWQCYSIRLKRGSDQEFDLAGVFKATESSPCGDLEDLPPAFVLPKVRSPIVFGLFKPLVLLPSEFRDWPLEHQSHVLRHELCHIRQHDILWLLGASLSTVLFWFNPLVWLLKRRLQLEQERTCDDAVIRSGVKASKYSETLLAAFESQVSVNEATKTSIHDHGEKLQAKADHAAEPEGLRPDRRPRLGRDRCADLLNERVRAVIDASYSHAPSKLGAQIFLGILMLGLCWQLSTIRFATTWLGVAPVTLELRITNTSDDAEERIEDGLVDLASRDLEMPYDAGRDRHQVIGLRFDNVDIPAGARIDKAEITFLTKKMNRGKANLNIAIQLDPMPATFVARNGDISKRIPDQQTRLEWSTSYIGTDPNVKAITPDLSKLVQQVTDLPGWRPGNALVFVIAGEEGEVTPAVSYDSPNGAESSPTLSITFIDEVSGLLLPRDK